MKKTIHVELIMVTLLEKNKSRFIKESNVERSRVFTVIGIKAKVYFFVYFEYIF